MQSDGRHVCDTVGHDTSNSSGEMSRYLKSTESAKSIPAIDEASHRSKIAWGVYPRQGLAADLHSAVSVFLDCCFIPSLRVGFLQYCRYCT